MATLTKAQDLLPLLGSVVNANDPVAALEQHGNAFSPALKTVLQPRVVPNAARLAQWRRAAGKAGKATFTAGHHATIVPRDLAPGEYEFSAGIKFSAANEILGGLLASRTIPDVIFLDEVLSSGDIDLLQGAFVLTPADGRIGRFQITSGTIVSSLGEGLDRVAFNIPFRLNFERIVTVMTGQIRKILTFATGTFRLSVGLTTRTVPVSIAARNLELQIDLSNSSDARLDIDASSPVKRKSPVPPGQIDGLGVILQNVLQQRLSNSLRLTISAAIPLPIGKLEIHETAIVTRGDAILAGIKLQGTPGAGNPATLAALFPNPDTNFFTRVHAKVFQLLLQSALHSGELTRIAKQTHPDAQISSASVSFGNRTIAIQTSGKIVDLCPLGVDLGFTVTTTLTITLDGPVITVKKDTNNDLDNVDAILCVITSLGIALLAAISVVVFQGLSLASGLAATLALGAIGALTFMLEFDGDDFSLVFGNGGDNKPTLIPLNFPFPGTDLLPELRGEIIRVDESTMLMAAHLSTRADVLNTYFYVRFMEADSVGIARAMHGATVRLMDRDSPAPAGDDVTLPGPSTSTTSHRLPTGLIATTTKTHYERTADEMAAQAVTDRNGAIRIYIPADHLASKGGVKVVETTRTNLDTDKETTGTSRTPVAEARPDFYFRVIRPNGTAVDTSQMPAGFFLNFQSHSVGTPANPLTITFGGGQVILMA